MPSKKPHVFARTVPDRVVELPPGQMRVEHEPDEFVEAVMASVMTRLSWDRVVVAAGGIAVLEVTAWGVSSGRRCRVTLTDARGRRLATLEHPADKVAGAWRVSSAPLLLTPYEGEHTARVAVPPSVTKEAEGFIMARAELPEVGIGWFSPPLRMGPRVAVRSVRFLEEGQGRVLREIPSGQRPVRIQAQVDAWPKEGLPEGARATVRLFRKETSAQPPDLKTGAEALVPVAELQTQVKGPAGHQGVEVLWQPTIERVMQEADAEQARYIAAGQWIYDEHARASGHEAKTYNGMQLLAEVEVWGAAGRTMDKGSRGGSGWLSVLDELDVQVVLGTVEGESGQPLSKAEVEVKLPDGTKRRVRLDEEGRAVLQNVPPGRCFLAVQKPAEGWPPLQGRPPVDGETSSFRGAPSSENAASFKAARVVEAFVRPGRPDRAEGAESSVTGIATRVVVWPPHVRLSLRRAFPGGDDLPGAAFRLEEASGGRLAEGTLPPEGEERPLLVGLPDGPASKVKLTVWPFGAGAQQGPPCAYLLEAAEAFEEAISLKGAQRRLGNLGYPGVEASGAEGGPVVRALRHVQALVGEAPTGRLDERTARFVEALHDHPA